MQKLTVSTVALILSILLTACGAANPISNASTKLDVDMNEFMFMPSTFTIPAGKEITVKLKNSGAINHDFIILKKGVEITGSFDHDKHLDNTILHVELEAGESGTFTFTAPTEVGEYQIVCGILGHFQSGMIGSLTVVGP